MPDGDACLLDSSILFWSGKGFSSAIPRRRLGNSGTPRSAQLDKDGSGDFRNTKTVSLPGHSLYWKSDPGSYSAAIGLR